MARRLREWATGKAGAIADKVYGLLSKYTGVKFTICPILHSYKNKWGVFLGRVALGSNDRYYRLNFTRGGGAIQGSSTDEIVSMDVWGKGVDPLKYMPSYTCSLNEPFAVEAYQEAKLCRREGSEGYGVSRVINYLKDFVLTPDKCLTESYGLNESASSMLKENMREAGDWSIEFLSQDMQWQSSWSNGSINTTQYYKDFLSWVKSQGRTFTGARKPTENEVINSTKKRFSTGQVVQSGIPQQVAVRAARASKNIPSVSIVKSSSAGEELPVDISDIYEEKVTFDQIQAGLIGAKDGPLAQMEQMRDSIKQLYDMGEYGKTMVVIWGRAGTGKSHTLMDMMEDLGINVGEQCIFIPQTLNAKTRHHKHMGKRIICVYS